MIYQAQRLGVVSPGTSRNNTKSTKQKITTKIRPEALAFSAASFSSVNFLFLVRLSQHSIDFAREQSVAV